MKRIRIAIVGAGPAGSYLAFQLSKNGLKVDIFDDTHPREKPCGGVISAESLEYVPETRSLKSANSLKKLSFQTPFGKKFKVTHTRESIAVNRIEFDAFLLKQAVDSGTNHISEHINRMTFADAEVLIHSNNETRSYDLVCGADGVRSVVARTVGMSLPAKELGFTMGGWGPVKGKKNEVVLRFGDHIGYAWIINRNNCSSIGIGGPMSQRNKLQKAFADFCVEQSVNLDELTPFSWVIPFSQSPAFLEKPRAGDGWLLIGDAAGFCDPLTGEGIHLALASAYQASLAILSGEPQQYDSLWKNTIGPNLHFGIKHRHLLASRPFSEALLDMLRRDPEMGLSLFKLL